MTDIILFSEDALLEQAARKIIATVNRRINITNVMGKRGFGHFQKRIEQIRRSAVALTFFVFLDGDELGNICPSDAINQWFNTRSPRNIYVRFAFHEVESWLLADRENMASFLNIPENVIPVIDDQKRDTKEILIQLARRSNSREIKQDLVPQGTFTSVVGPAYSSRMSRFISTTWDVRAAATRNSEFGTRLQADRCNFIASIARIERGEVQDRGQIISI